MRKAVGAAMFRHACRRNQPIYRGADCSDTIHQIVADLVDKLPEKGYSEEDCGKFLGGKLYRVMKQVWI